MYSTLNDATARKASGEFLHNALNECRPDSGAYLAAKYEIQRRADVSKNWRKVGFAIILGLVACAFWGSLSIRVVDFQEWIG